MVVEFGKPWMDAFRPSFEAVRQNLYPDSLGRRKALAKRVELDSFEGMIRPGFLLGDERSALIALARDGSVTHRLARRANALVLLDDGLSCEQVARVLLLDDDTIRRWHGAFAEGGRKALMRFEAGGSARSERGATGEAGRVGSGGLAALDGSDRRVDRIGIRGRIRKPLGTGRASASPRPRISQARSHSSPSRRDQAARVHQALRETDECLGPR